MKAITKALILPVLSSCLICHPAAAQSNPELVQKIEALIGTAFQSAAAAFPCKVKTRGKLEMIRWEDVDRCVNEAAGKIDWPELSSRLRELRTSIRDMQEAEFAALVASALENHNLPYEKMFVVKKDRALLPLTNSILKFLPADSLLNLPVIDKVGTEMGSFAGVYSYERSGGAGSGAGYRLTLFQYSDKTGEIRTAPDKLLLDSFGIPWRQAAGQPGFRLSSDKLQLGRK
jgi:hypothetical protein